MRPEIIEEYRQYAVTDVNSVDEFMTKYYKREKYTDRKNGYAESLLNDYKNYFAKNGFCVIISIDSNTGNLVTFFPKIIHRKIIVK
jgi:hypothetical protein